MKNIIIIITNLWFIFATPRVLIDNVHGWGQFPDEANNVIHPEILLPNYDYEYIDFNEIEIESIISTGTLENLDTIYFNVPENQEVLYFKMDYSNSYEFSYPYFTIVDPNNLYVVYSGRDFAYLENPPPGEYELRFINYNSESPVSYQIGTGHHFYTPEFLGQYDLIMHLRFDSYSYFYGFLNHYSNFELNSIESFFENGGRFMLINEPISITFDKPVIRIYSDEDTNLDLSLNFPGDPTYLNPDAMITEFKTSKLIQWDNVEVNQEDYTELLYEGTGASPLHYLTVQENGSIIEVQNNSSIPLRGIHLLKLNNDNTFSVGKTESLSAHQSESITEVENMQADELYAYLQNILITEAKTAGMTDFESHEFFEEFPWLVRWLHLASKTNEWCGIYHFTNSDYNRFIPIETSIIPSEMVRVMWVFSENIPQFTSKPPFEPPFDTNLNNLNLESSLKIHEYGVIENRYPNPVQQNRLLEIFNLIFQDDWLMDETNYVDNYSNPLLHTFGNNETAQDITNGIDQILAYSAGFITATNNDTLIPIVMGDDDTHIGWSNSDILPPYNYVVAKENGNGRLIAIPDIHILNDVEDNVEFLENCMNWLTETGNNILHITPDGSDETGDGSVENPFATIQHGINTAVDGDTVLVAPGTYFETPYINNKNIVLASHRIIDYNDSLIDATIIDGSEISGAPVVFIINTNSSMVFDGFTIRGGNGYVFFDDSNMGSLYYKNSDAVNRNLKIHDNHYDGSAKTAGIMVTDSGSPQFKNILIYDNSSTVGTYWLVAGGETQFESVNPVFENVTFVNTSEPESLYCMIIGGNETIVTMTNCIFWNGEMIHESEFFHFDSTLLDISYSNIQGGWDGEGNINTDPLFTDPENGDFTLQPNSPCIDAGDPNSPLDLDGTVADMGAFYFDQLSITNIPDKMIPQKLYLSDGFPNPFNPIIKFEFGVPLLNSGGFGMSDVLLNVYDIRGVLIKNLINENYKPGNYSVIWNAEDLPSGVYLIRLQIGNESILTKVSLLK